MNTESNKVIPIDGNVLDSCHHTGNENEIVNEVDQDQHNLFTLNEAANANVSSDDNDNETKIDNLDNLDSVGTSEDDEHVHAKMLEKEKNQIHIVYSIYNQYEDWKRMGLQNRRRLFIYCFSLLLLLGWIDRCIICIVFGSGGNRNKDVGLNSKKFHRWQGMLESNLDLEEISRDFEGTSYYATYLSKTNLTFEQQLIPCTVFTVLQAVVSFIIYNSTYFRTSKNLNHSGKKLTIATTLFSGTSWFILCRQCLFDFHRVEIYGEIERGTYQCLFFTGLCMPIALGDKILNFSITITLCLHLLFSNYSSGFTLYGFWLYLFPYIVSAIMIGLSQDHDLYQLYSRERSTAVSNNLSVDDNIDVILNHSCMQLSKQMEYVQLIPENKQVDKQYQQRNRIVGVSNQSLIQAKYTTSRSVIDVQKQRGFSSSSVSNSKFEIDDLSNKNNTAREDLDQHKKNQCNLFLQESIYMCKLLFIRTSTDLKFLYSSQVKSFNFESMCSRVFSLLECKYNGGIPLFYNGLGLKTNTNSGLTLDTCNIYIQRKNENYMNMMIFLLLSQDIRDCKKSAENHGVISISIEFDTKRNGYQIHLKKIIGHSVVVDVLSKIRTDIYNIFSTFSPWNKSIKSPMDHLAFEEKNVPYFADKRHKTEQNNRNRTQSNLFDDSAVIGALEPDLNAIDSGCSISRLMDSFVGSSFFLNSSIEFCQHDYTNKDIKISKKSIFIPAKDVEIRNVERNFDRSQTFPQWILVDTKYFSLTSDTGVNVDAKIAEENKFILSNFEILGIPIKVCRLEELDDILIYYRENFNDKISLLILDWTWDTNNPRLQEVNSMIFDTIQKHKVLTSRIVVLSDDNSQNLTPMSIYTVTLKLSKGVQVGHVLMRKLSRHSFFRFILNYASSTEDKDNNNTEKTNRSELKKCSFYNPNSSLFPINLPPSQF